MSHLNYITVTIPNSIKKDTTKWELAKLALVVDTVKAYVRCSLKVQSAEHIGRSEHTDKSRKLLKYEMLYI